MTDKDRELIAAATEVQGHLPLGDGYDAAAVGAALRTESGRVFTGVSVELACGIGFCAEHAAIAEMLKHRETRIVEIVAVNRSGVLPPCGRCREMMMLVNAANRDTRVLLGQGRSVALHELLPEHWMGVRPG
ncbi:MAG: cytidine deaminase [Phycisphaera sp.]|nr:cytidine deaminase [Phycisphaera sp.]